MAMALKWQCLHSRHYHLGRLPVQDETADEQQQGSGRGDRVCDTIKKFRFIMIVDH